MIHLEDIPDYEWRLFDRHQDLIIALENATTAAQRRRIEKRLAPVDAIMNNSILFRYLRQQEEIRRQRSEREREARRLVDNEVKQAEAEAQEASENEETEKGEGKEKATASDTQPTAGPSGSGGGIADAPPDASEPVDTGNSDSSQGTPDNSAKITPPAAPASEHSTAATTDAGDAEGSKAAKPPAKRTRSSKPKKATKRKRTSRR